MNNHNRASNDNRLKMYKNNGFQNDTRRKRRDEEVQIRKQKRLDIFEHRRKLSQSYLSQEYSPQIPSEIMRKLKDHQTEAEAIEMIIGKLGSEWSLQDIAENNILSILADIYCNRINLERVKGLIARLYQLCAKREIKKRSLDNVCAESVCSILNDNEESVAIMCDAIQALSLFVGANVVYRNIAFDMAVVPQLFMATAKQDARLNRCTMLLISQLVHKLAEYSPEVDEVAPLMELIADGMKSDDKSILIDSVTACSKLAEWDQIWQNMNDFGLMSLMVDSIRIDNDLTKGCIIRAIDYITQSTNEYTQELVNAGLFESIGPLIFDKNFSKDVCFILSNVSLDGEPVLDRLISSGLLKNVAQIMETAEYATRKEAAFTICHCCTSMSRAHIAYILDIGLLPAFTDMLTCMDVELVIYILESIESLLQYGEINLSPDYTNPVAVRLEEIGCKEKIEFLMQSMNIDVHCKAYAIIEGFFDDDEIVQYNGCAEEIKASVDGTIETIMSRIIGNNA